MPRATVTSPVVGTLALLHVEDGVQVEAGETIGEVESMKLYLAITAPVAGVIRWRYQLGEIVGDGDAIAEISY